MPCGQVMMTSTDDMGLDSSKPRPAAQANSTPQLQEPLRNGGEDDDDDNGTYCGAGVELWLCLVLCSSQGQLHDK